MVGSFPHTENIISIRERTNEKEEKKLRSEVVFLGTVSSA